MGWLKEPWLHFLFFGIALFVLTAALNDSSPGPTNQRIDVTATEIEWIVRNWEARWQRPPTESELRGLVDHYIRQEVMYREALSMGLDRNDDVIRRRMVQKLEFLTEDLVAQTQPSDAELLTYFRANLDDYVLPERRSFSHIYFNIDLRGDAAAIEAEQTLTQLRTSPQVAIDPAELGDRFMLAHEYVAQSEAEVAGQFGQRFASELFATEPGLWHGPVASGYGWHLVRVTDVWENSEPEFTKVRDDVQRDYSTDLKDRAREAMYTSLATDYQIIIDEEAILASAIAVDTENEQR
jgi:hypothetical protein